MPTYEYRCEVCGYTFERFQNMSDKPISKCPKCGGKVQRLVGIGAGVIFKGSGSHKAIYDRATSEACSRERPCCGRDTPCDKRPCES